MATTPKQDSTKERDHASVAGNGALSDREAAENAIAAALEHGPEWITRESLGDHVREVRKQGEAQEQAKRKHEVAALLADVESRLPGVPSSEVEQALTQGNRLKDRAVDIGALIRDGVPPVEYLPGEFAHRMVYSEGVTGFHGHPEHGKSALVQRLALDAMRAGMDVVYLDHENGERSIRRRFVALGADPDLLSERLHYIPFPGRPDWGQLAELWDEYPGAVGVWDSMRGILRSLGLQENEASEVGQFLDALVEFTLTRGIASLVLDHVTKAATAASPYARGSGDKLAAMQATWYVNRTQPFSDTQSGEIEVLLHKARDGGMEFRHTFKVGDGHGNFTFEKIDGGDSPKDCLDEKIIRYLKSSAPADCSKHQIEEAVGGKATAVREAVEALAEAERIETVAGTHPRFKYRQPVELELEF